MNTQKIQLTKSLQKNGWEIISKESLENEWWIDELWLIQSIWSPLGCELWLSFLVDPEFQGNRKKGQGVWLVGAVDHEPQDKLQACKISEIFLKPQWEKNLPKFQYTLNKWRDNFTS